MVGAERLVPIVIVGSKANFERELHILTVKHIGIRTYTPNAKGILLFLAYLSSVPLG